MNDITSDDKLWAALAWVFWPIAIVILLMEDRKSRAFQKYHAVSSLAFVVAFFVAYIIITTITFGIGCFLGLLGLIVFYWAYKAYQGEWVVVPLLTDFIKKQGWV